MAIMVVGVVAVGGSGGGERFTVRAYGLNIDTLTHTGQRADEDRRTDSSTVGRTPDVWRSV